MVSIPSTNTQQSQPVITTVTKTENQSFLSKGLGVVGRITGLSDIKQGVIDLSNREFKKGALNLLSGAAKGTLIIGGALLAHNQLTNFVAQTNEKIAEIATKFIEEGIVGPSSVNGVDITYSTVCDSNVLKQTCSREINANPGSILEASGVAKIAEKISISEYVPNLRGLKAAFGY